MKRTFFFIVVIVLVMSLIACGNNKKRNTDSISPNVQKKIKQEIIDKYPNDKETLLYDGKDDIFITAYNKVDVSVRVGHDMYNIPKVIDILCPIVLEVVEKNNCTLETISIGYYEEDEKGDMIKDTIVNWRSNDGKTGFLFVAVAGMGKKDCTSEDVLKHFDSIDWEKLDKVASNEKETKQKLEWYMVNVNTKKFHKKNCSIIKNATTANVLERFGTREQLIKNGYSPCTRCNP